MAVVCINCDFYDEILPNKVRVIGLHYQNGLQPLFQKIESFHPTDIICCTPILPILKWCLKNNLHTLPLLADSFQEGGLRNWWRNYKTKRTLNRFEWVGNHHRNACQSLINIGVKPLKVIAWDYPPFITPAQFPVKKLPHDIKLLYVGAITETKGIGTLIEALSLLRRRGIPATVTVAGKGDFSPFEHLAERLNVKEFVTYLGLIDNTMVIPLMAEHTIVLVPSWHEYPEGLPLTIYEGLCSRTPLIVSDHPMFLGNIIDGTSGLIFRSKDSGHLAQKIEELLNDPQLYSRISSNTQKAWEHLQIPVKWHQLIEHWLARDNDWLASNRYKQIGQMGRLGQVGQIGL